MWGYIRKIIQFIIFSFLLEMAVMVGYMSLDGILESEEFKYFQMATCMVPGIMTSLGVLSVLRVQRKRLASRYEKDAVSTAAMVILVISMIIGVIGAAIGAVVLANYLYTI